MVGSAVGADGVGGSGMRTTFLMLFCGIKPAFAVGTDLLYASSNKAFGVTLHGRNGSVDWKLVGWLSAGSLPATVITLLLLRRLDSGPALDHLIDRKSVG